MCTLEQSVNLHADNFPLHRPASEHARYIVCLTIQLGAFVFSIPSGRGPIPSSSL